jgi:hypothetical protein
MYTLKILIIILRFLLVFSKHSIKNHLINLVMLRVFTKLGNILLYDIYLYILKNVHQFQLVLYSADFFQYNHFQLEFDNLDRYGLFIDF